MVDQRWLNYAFGIDVSGIQKVVEYNKLSPYVDFYIARLGKGQWTYKNVVDPAVAIDQLFATHCQGAYDTNKPFGAYWVFDPTVGQDPKYPEKDRQIAPILYGLKNKACNFLAIDVEIWKDGDGNQISGTNIADKVEVLIGRLHNLLPDMKIGIYTGEWFFEYSPTLRIKIDNFLKHNWFFTWLAKYPNDADWGNESITVAQWADFRGKYAPEWDVNKSFPWMCNAATKIWQYSGDRYTAEGHYGEIKGAASVIDCNFFNGTLAQMKDWCGYSDHATTTQPETETPTETPEEETGTPVFTSDQFKTLKDGQDAIVKLLNTILEKLSHLEWIMK